MALAGVDGSTREGSRLHDVVEAARPFVGVLVIGLWVVWALLAWQLEPRTVDAAQVRADIASGQILTYRVTGQAHPQDAWLPPATGDGWDTLGLDEVTGLPRDDAALGAATGILYWVDAPFGQTRHFDVDDPRSTLDRGSASTTYEGLIKEMRAGGVSLQSTRVDELPYQDMAFWPGWAAIVLGFGSVLLSYRPTRVTRWGWFWLVWFVPLGLGLVALAAGELVRPARRGEDAPRMRGGHAWLLGLVLGLLGSVSLGGAAWHATSLWIP